VLKGCRASVSALMTENGMQASQARETLHYGYEAGSLRRVAFTPDRIPTPKSTMPPTAIQCPGICAKCAQYSESLNVFMVRLCGNPQQCRLGVPRSLARLAFAASVSAMAINVRSLFRRLTSGTAEFAGACFAGADWMCTLFCWIRCHAFLLLRSGSFRPRSHHGRSQQTLLSS
jgi:hypothetical protein